MEKVCILTDSCSDIQAHDNIYILPVQITCNGHTYKDGKDIDAMKVYEMQEKHLMKTASPLGEDVFCILNQIKDDGYTHVIAVILSSGLSGTYNQIRLYCESQDDLQITVLDSKSASMGIGAIALTLSKYCHEGYSYQELVCLGQKLCESTYAFFSIDDLDLLYKGGRIGKATAVVGTTLKIKPILSFEKEEGEIYVAAKLRGSKKIKNKLIELIEKQQELHPESDYILLAADGNNLQERQLLEAMLKERFPHFKGFYTCHIGAALSCYLGQGLLGAGIQFIEK